MRPGCRRTLRRSSFRCATGASGVGGLFPPRRTADLASLCLVSDAASCVSVVGEHEDKRSLFSTSTKDTGLGVEIGAAGCITSSSRAGGS